MAPNVALTPAIRSLPSAAQGLAAFVTQVFNNNLAGIVAQLPAVLPGIGVAQLDAYQLLNAIVANPASFGLTAVTTACVTPNIAPFTCRDPAAFLFWDGIHPTKTGHEILAREAATVLQ